MYTWRGKIINSDLPHDIRGGGWLKLKKAQQTNKGWSPLHCAELLLQIFCSTATTSDGDLGWGIKHKKRLYSIYHTINAVFWRCISNEDLTVATRLLGDWVSKEIIAHSALDSSSLLQTTKSHFEMLKTWIAWKVPTVGVNACHILFVLIWTWCAIVLWVSFCSAQWKMYCLHYTAFYCFYLPT